jgi:hypothetical protein
MCNLLFSNSCSCHSFILIAFMVIVIHDCSRDCKVEFMDRGSHARARKHILILRQKTEKYKKQEEGEIIRVFLMQPADYCMRIIPFFILAEYVAVLLLFYILQKGHCNKSCIFFEYLFPCKLLLPWNKFYLCCSHFTDSCTTHIFWWLWWN